jgi:hypothetical protein
MKTRVTLFFLLMNTIAFSQQYDTIQHKIGKVGGFERIRELNSKGEIKKVWFTNWLDNGKIKKSFSQYKDNNIKVTSIDSVFDNIKNLIQIERKIGTTIEGDKQEFDNSGNLTSRNISLYINGKFIVFQKYYNNGWNYRSIIDGNPPDYIPINPESFEEAVKIYNDRLLIDKIIN